MSSSQLSLALGAEKTSLASNVEHALSVLASIKAPETPPATRQPLEIVAVVDRSGSMSGSKMKSMKEATTFLISHGLQKDDTFALVSFDNTVDLKLPAAKMDAAGKKKALETVSQLQTGGSTNLSGGLLKGIDVLSQLSGNANANKAILLFTDGIANNGITDSGGIISAAQGAMAASPMTIFTFGFGSDHSESLLRSLSEQTNGLYYYVEKSEDIPVSFADCLGGLVSVVAQNAVLRLEGVDGNSVSKALCHYKREPIGSEGIALQLGDIYAEDEKDILLTLKLPLLSAPRAAAAPSMLATLRYFSVADSQMVEVRSELQLARPEATPADQQAPQRLVEQRERIAVSEAMAEASNLADRGEIDAGRHLLQAAVARAKASPCADSPVVANILRDAAAVESGYSDMHAYRNWGGKMSKMQAMSHMQQRSTHTAGVAYERKSKMAMKSMFSSSSCSSSSAPPMPPSPPSAPSPRAASAAASTSSAPVQALNLLAVQNVQSKPSKKKASMFRLPSFRSSSNEALDIE